MVEDDFTDRRDQIAREVLAYRPLPSNRVRRRRWLRCTVEVLVLGVACSALIAACLAHPDHASDVTIGILMAVLMLGTFALASVARSQLERDLGRIPPLQFDEVMRLCRANAAIGAAVGEWRASLGELRAIEGRMLCAASDRLTLLGVEHDLSGAPRSDAAVHRAR